MKLKWLLLPVLLPTPALSQSSLNGFPALDATQNQQPVIPSAGLPSAVFLDARKDTGYAKARRVLDGFLSPGSICSCFHLGSRVPRGSTDGLSQLLVSSADVSAAPIMR